MVSKTRFSSRWFSIKNPMSSDCRRMLSVLRDFFLKSISLVMSCSSSSLRLMWKASDLRKEFEILLGVLFLEGFSLVFFGLGYFFTIFGFGFFFDFFFF